MAVRLHCAFHLSVLLLQFGVFLGVEQFGTIQGVEQCVDNNDTTRCLSRECSAPRRCGGLLRIKDGGFQLPRDMDTTCLDCTWVLLVPSTKKVKLTFPQFVLGRGDYVRVFDGRPTSDSLIVEYSEGDVSVALVSSGNRMTVNVRSNLCGRRPVVRGTFTPIDCGGLFYLFSRNKHKRHQIVHSPNYPRQYPSYSNCLWTFVSGESRLLSANIKINLISNGHSADRVVLRESLENSSDTLHTYAGSRVVRNKQHRVRNVPGITIAFSSGKGKRGKGFHLTIVSLMSVSDCTYEEQFENGSVTFTNFGKTATYSCWNGFKLVGDEQIYCGKEGWSQSSIPSCTPVDSCTAPKNMEIVGGNQSVLLGSCAKLACSRGFVLSNSVASISVLCNFNGQWEFSSDSPSCKEHLCGPPPPAPQPNGERQGNQTDGVYPVGSVVNYTCPDGYGLEGIPYRICTGDFQWKPATRLHTCKVNLVVCPDPGIPENGIRRVKSFSLGRLASFGCKRGYIAEGPQLRECGLNGDGKASWTRKQLVCKSKFKSSMELAEQLKQSFVDRTIACIGDGDNPTLVTPGPGPRPTNTTSTGNQVPELADCRGRAVVVGEGCIDLIYIIDCSNSVGTDNFNQSLDFTGRSASLFDIDGGVARVSLITYDDEVYQHFKLGEKKTRADTINAIRKADFCAGNTATRKVLTFLKDKVINTTRHDCRKAVFLFSDGNNNWAGDPKQVAKELKKEKNLEIYTIAFGISEQSINSENLKSLASRPEYFFEVSDVFKFRQALKNAFQRNIDYCKECGISLSPECRTKKNGECDSEKGAWPWMVGIYRVIRGNPVFHCGGTLVGECWVLTAAHCLDYGGFSHSDLRIVVGDTERFIPEYSEETFYVERALVHPQYVSKFDLNYHSSPKYNRDIALLKLPCNVTCSPRVRIACLPVAQDIIYYNPETDCIVAGWGASEKVGLGGDAGAKATLMKQLNLPIADKDQCILSKAAHFRADVTNFTVCAGDGTGKNDPCQGDSGGPLFCKRQDQDTYVVVGIVSWGVGCKQPNSYGVFTHVLNLIDWVNEQMIIYKCQPPPDHDDDNEEEECEKPPQIY